MLTRSQHASIEEYVHDLRSGLREVGKNDLGGLASVIRSNGYEWLETYVEDVMSRASGSR